MKKALIVGLRSEKSGKTATATALLDLLREAGARACGFKPRAGNNIWYDYDVISAALREGRIYGLDAKLLREFSAIKLQEEVINPVHRLWTIQSCEEISIPSKLPCFILDRISIVDRAPKTFILINDSLPSNALGSEVLSELTEALQKGGNIIYKVKSVAELKRATKLYDYALSSAYRKILKEKIEYVIIESYSNVALPWENLGNIDLTLAVEPGRVAAYDPERYFKAVKLFPKAEIGTERVSGLLKPLATIRVPPLRSSELIGGLKEGLLTLFKKLKCAFLP